MPPKPQKPATKKATKKTPAAVPLPVKVSAGSGMIAGLELWCRGTTGPFILVDTTTDNRFAADVATWNAAATG